MRWSKPARKFSTTTLRACSRAFSNAARTSSPFLQVERDAAAVVGVERLDDDGIAEALGGASPRASAVRTTRWRGTGRPSSPRMRLVSSLSEAISTAMWRVSRRDRGLDALLVLAVAELDEAVVVEAHPRDVARLGGAHERARRRAELAPLREVDELDELGREVERGGAARIALASRGRRSAGSS